MALFTTNETGPNNDGGTFGNESPGVPGIDYPDPSGGDEIAFGGAHTLTILEGQDVTLKGNTATNGVIGAPGAALVVLGTLRQDGDLYLDAGTDYTLGSVSAGAAHYLGGFDFGPGNDDSNVDTTYTFTSPLDSPNQIFLEGGAWDSYQAPTAGALLRTSVFNSGHTIFNYGATNNTGKFKPNHEVNSAASRTFVNSGVMEFQNIYDLKLNQFFVGTSDLDLGTIILSSWSTAGSKPDTMLANRSGAPAGGETHTADAIVIDGRTGTRPNLIYMSMPGTIDKFISIQGGRLFNGLNLAYTINQSFFYDVRDIPFGMATKEVFSASGKHVWLGNVSQINSHVFDLAENNTVELHNWLIDIPCTTDDGPDIASSASWSTGSLSVQDVVLLTHQEGALVNALGAGTSVNVPVTVEHNTVVVRGAGIGYYGHLAKTEVGGAGDARWEDLTLRSNLSVMLDGVTGDTASVAFQNPGQPNQVTNTNYNAFYNVGDRYLNVEFSPVKTEGADADFGLNDVTLSADPFVDSTRTVTTWITGQAGLGSVSAWLDELVKYSTDAWTASYDPWATDTGTYDWVRRGYEVTDAALNGTAHDAGVIGAMPYQATGPFPGVDVGDKFDLRPWRSSAGDFVAIGRNASTTTKLKAMLAADPEGNWAEQDAANAPTAASGVIEATSVDVAGDILKVAFQVVDATGSDTVYFARFDMLNRVWLQHAGASQTVVRAQNTADNAAVAIVQRPYGSSSDELAIAFQDLPEDVSGFKSRVGYATSTDDGATWSYAGYLNGGVATNQFNVRAVLGTGRHVHFMWIEFAGAAASIMERTLEFGVGLSTLRDTGYDASSVVALGQPITLIRGASSVVQVPFTRSTADASVLRFASSDDPSSFSVDTITASADIYDSDGQAAACPAVDGQIAHVMFLDDATQALQYSQDQTTNSWVTPTQLSAGPYEQVWCRAVDNNGPYLGALIWNGTSVFYTQLSISQTFNSLSGVYFGDRRSVVGPFIVGGAAYMVGTNIQRSRLMAMKTANTTNPASGDWAEAGTQIHLPINYRYVEDYVGRPGELRVHVARLRSDRYIDAVSLTEQGDVHVHVFDTQSDTWTTRLEKVIDYSDPDWGFVSVAGIDFRRLSTGTYVIAGTAKRYSITPGRLLVISGTLGGTWTNEGVAASDANGPYVNPVVVGPDSADNVGILFKGLGNPALQARSRAVGGTLSSTIDVDTTVDTAYEIAGEGLMLGDVGYVPYVDANNRPSVVRWDIGTAPTMLAGVGGRGVYNHGATTQQPLPSSALLMASIGGSPHLIYIDTNRDVRIAPAQSAAGLGQVVLSGVYGRVSGFGETGVATAMLDESGSLRLMRLTVPDFVDGLSRALWRYMGRSLERTLH